MAAVSKRHPPVYFIRHGETDWNRQGLIQGWIDIPLNETGHSQARAIATTLVNVRALHPDFNFIVSPLTRARQTMGYIAGSLGLESEQVVVAEAVKELGFGVWEGKPFGDLKASPVYPSDPGAHYYWRPEGGESYQDGEARMDAFLDTLGGPTMVVAHGAIGRCLMGRSAGLSPAELVQLRTPQGCYCRLEHGRIDWFDAGGDAA
jgi:broad specificity phosphatase PhoE